MRYSLPIIFFLLSRSLCAQTSDTLTQKPEIRISGFAEVFYVYDFNRPEGSSRQAFLYNHNRHNEFNLNLGYIKLSTEHKKYRGNLALQAGTYANDNYAAEPGLLKNIFEANAGIALNRKNNIWLDAGIFASHIGFESAASLENPTMTRSILAENSPYYLSGAKLSYEPTGKWQFAALILNGWQRIQRLPGNSMPSAGSQIVFTPSEKTLINWSTFIGTDDPDSTRRMRYFNNLYGQFQLSRKFGLIAGFDVGIQQRAKNSPAYDTWYSPVFIAQYAINPKWKTAVRAEYYQDRTGIIIPSRTKNGFETTGFSWNFDYMPAPEVICRIEGRWLTGRDEIFITERGQVRDNLFVGISVAIEFSESLRK